MSLDMDLDLEESELSSLSELEEGSRQADGETTRRKLAGNSEQRESNGGLEYCTRSWR